MGVTQRAIVGHEWAARGLIDTTAARRAASVGQEGDLFGNIWRMVMQECPPSLARWPSPFDHVFGDARLRDLKPELEQFAVDAWHTPKRILDAHPPDQFSQLRADLRSPSPWARLRRQ
jgi:hypothetical protein